MDHTNVEVGDAGKGHGHVVVKPVEVWAGSGGKQTGRDSMQNRSVLHGSSCKLTGFAQEIRSVPKEREPGRYGRLTRSVDVYRVKPGRACLVEFRSGSMDYLYVRNVNPAGIA